MSIDQSSINDHNGSAHKVPDHIMLDMYHSIRDMKISIETLKISIAEERLKNEQSEKMQREFKTSFSKLVDRVDQLTLNEARTSVKFGILTFVATLVFVTAFNMFVSSNEVITAERQAPGLLPPKGEMKIYRYEFSDPAPN